MEHGNLWEQVGNRCLSDAIALLESETVPTAATVGTVKNLVEIAISIDMLNLRWEQKTRSYAEAFQEQPFLQREAKS